MPDLLSQGVETVELSPHCGTEILGVQIVSVPSYELLQMNKTDMVHEKSELSNAGLDELALLCAQRGCLVFRDQDFTNLGFERQKEIASYVTPCFVYHVV